jgi:hypothetical protein
MAFDKGLKLFNRHFSPIFDLDLDRILQGLCKKSVDGFNIVQTHAVITHKHCMFVPCYERRTTCTRKCQHCGANRGSRIGDNMEVKGWVPSEVLRLRWYLQYCIVTETIPEIRGAFGELQQQGFKPASSRNEGQV